MSLLDRMKIKAGDPITREGFEELKKAWMEVYFVFNLCMSPTNPAKRELLDQIKAKLSEAHELICHLEL